MRVKTRPTVTRKRRISPAKSGKIFSILNSLS